MNTISNKAENILCHYDVGGIETIDVIGAKLSLEEFVGFCRGNVIKYVTRAGYKGGAAQDYKKAQYYLEALINKLEKP